MSAAGRRKCLRSLLTEGSQIFFVKLQVTLLWTLFSGEDCISEISYARLDASTQSKWSTILPVNCCVCTDLTKPTVLRTCCPQA